MRINDLVKSLEEMEKVNGNIELVFVKEIGKEENGASKIVVLEPTENERSIAFGDKEGITFAVGLVLKDSNFLEDNYSEDKVK